MKLELYRTILAKYESIGRRNCLEDLVAEFPEVPKNTLESIISQEYQRKTQRSFWMHQNSEKTFQYYLSYKEAVKSSQECGSLVKLADEVDLSPALMAKLILEQHYREKCPNSSDIALKEMVDEHLKDPSLIEDPQLALEVNLCNQEDLHYGPVAEAVKSMSGLEYECNLRKELKRLGVSFSQEPSLRSSGFDKTPDVRLEVPIAVGGRIVNWIESKASFGDVERHKEYLVEQYARYKIRFGPGLVIYWFGFIDELKLYKRKNLFIMDHMPHAIKLMDPLKYMKQKDISEDKDS